MFQTFTSSSTEIDIQKRLVKLRQQMKSHHFDWYLVPHSDEYQNEYLPEYAERLSWITGFTGSAGFALIGLKTAFLFVDGRYTAQAKSQVNLDYFEIVDLIATPPPDFAKSLVKNAQVVGYDPKLITINQNKAWLTLCENVAASLTPQQNLIDKIWHDQPDEPRNPAWNHREEYSGKSAIEKLAELKQLIQNSKADFLVQSDPASIAWTFNLRGSDVVHNPLTLATALIPAKATNADLFIHKDKLDKTGKAELSALAQIHEPDQLDSTIAKIASGKSFLCDPNLVSVHLKNTIESAGGNVVLGRDPVALLRAVKNQTELQGARKAHIRDGVAMVTFLSWLDAQPPGSVDEISAAKKLEQYRKAIAETMGSKLQEISFDTISGAGANGAIIHYRVNEDTNAVLENNSVYLVDSGAQYFDGTTDITRTIAIGAPPKQAICDNTLVLKGHIAIARAIFPQGTRGVDLDSLARIALWQDGKDYAHGTGHGIGSYLNVHEGPQSLSKRGMEPFVSGMILSNEPGFYKEGEYGIRIENLVIVENTKINQSNMLRFETITLCPFDKRLIAFNLLSNEEIEWINSYHHKVFTSLSPYLKGDALEWLDSATSSI